MDSAGEKDAHKRTRTSCIKTSTRNFFESTGNRVTAYSDGQYIIYNLDVLSKNGGHKKFTNGLSFQANLGTTIKEKSNCDSRHRILSQDRFLMEASPFSAPKTFCDKKKPINRTFCFEGVLSASNISSLSRQPILSSIQSERVLYSMKSRSGGMVGLIQGQLIHFDVYKLTYWTI